MSFDSHCHLTSERFDQDRADVLARARAAGVSGMVCIASTPEDALHAVALAEAEPDVWATAGVHPHEAGAVEEGWQETVASLLVHPRVVAVGECGLDYHYDYGPRDAQLRVLSGQVTLARRFDLPLVVHARSADEDMIRILEDLPDGVRGVLHCFTGGDALLEAGLDRDWYVSFSGIATFRNFDAQEQLRRVPGHRILVETDSPYLAPVPHRGKRNEPAFVTETTRRVAEIRGEDPESFAGTVTENARAFYRLDPPATPVPGEEP